MSIMRETGNRHWTTRPGDTTPESSKQISPNLFLAKGKFRLYFVGSLSFSSALKAFLIQDMTIL